MFTMIRKLEEGQVTGEKDRTIEGQNVCVTRRSSQGRRRNFMTVVSWRTKGCGRSWSEE